MEMPVMHSPPSDMILQCSIDRFDRREPHEYCSDYRIKYLPPSRSWSAALGKHTSNAAVGMDATKCQKTLNAWSLPDEM